MFRARAGTALVYAIVFNNNVMMVMVTVCGVQRPDEGAGRDG